jgi:hypothetical protein
VFSIKADRWVVHTLFCAHIVINPPTRQHSVSFFFANSRFRGLQALFYLLAPDLEACENRSRWYIAKKVLKPGRFPEVPLVELSFGFRQTQKNGFPFDFERGTMPGYDGRSAGNGTRKYLIIKLRP